MRYCFRRELRVRFVATFPLRRGNTVGSFTSKAAISCATFSRGSGTVM